MEASWKEFREWEASRLVRSSWAISQGARGREREREKTTLLARAGPPFDSNSCNTPHAHAAHAAGCCWWQGSLLLLLLLLLLRGRAPYLLLLLLLCVEYYVLEHMLHACTRVYAEQRPAAPSGHAQSSGRTRFYVCTCNHSNNLHSINPSVSRSCKMQSFPSARSRLSPRMHPTSSLSLSNNRPPWSSGVQCSALSHPLPHRDSKK